MKIRLPDDGQVKARLKQQLDAMSDEDMAEVFLELDKFEDSGGLGALKAILNHRYDILVGEPSPPAPAVSLLAIPRRTTEF